MDEKTQAFLTTVQKKWHIVDWDYKEDEIIITYSAKHSQPSIVKERKVKSASISWPFLLVNYL
jgi:hypothetical protein